MGLPQIAHRTIESGLGIGRKMSAAILRRAEQFRNAPDVVGW